jgi:hypothetical protein
MPRPVGNAGVPDACVVAFDTVEADEVGASRYRQRVAALRDEEQRLAVTGFVWADPRRPGNRARAGLRENISGALEPLLQVLHVPGHLPLRLAPHDERHEQLAEPVPLEVGLDRRARPRPVIERLDWPFRIALTGPSMPRAAQLLGGLKLVVSIVLVCSRPPSRRTMTTFDPTARGPPSSARELTRLSCHSSSRDKSGFVRRSRRESGSIFRGTWAARTDPIR